MILGLAALLFLIPAAPARAHSNSPHLFESVPDQITLAHLAHGIEVEMIDHDANLRLVNKSGNEVIVMGYDGEPYARLAANGEVFLNQRSPAYFLNQDRYATTPVEASADPEAPAKWVKQSDDGTLIWFDRRSHSMSDQVPAVVDDTSVSQPVRDYQIPLRVNGEPAKLGGTLYWNGQSEFPMGIVAGLLIVTAMCAGLGFLGIEALRRAEPESHGASGGEVAPSPGPPQ